MLRKEIKVTYNTCKITLMNRHDHNSRVEFNPAYDDEGREQDLIYIAVREYPKHDGEGNEIPETYSHVTVRLSELKNAVAVMETANLERG